MWGAPHAAPTSCYSTFSRGKRKGRRFSYLQHQKEKEETLQITFQRGVISSGGVSCCQK